MRDRVLCKQLDIDWSRAASGLAERSGTLALHTQREFHGSGCSALLFSPLWILEKYAGTPPRWSGRVPSAQPPMDVAPIEIAHRLAAAWARMLGPVPPFLPGIAGFLGYELGPQRWAIPSSPSPGFQLPDLWLALYDRALVLDRAGRCSLVVVDPRPVGTTSCALPELFELAADQLREALDRSAATVAQREPGDLDVESFSASWHRAAVGQIQHHLRKGDIYQANLTGFVRAATPLRPYTLFQDQARYNPVPFAAYLRTESASITCHSPERLLRVDGTRVQTAPIKGTVASGPRARERLLESTKDRAEHVMIVDLCRNDLGRRCRYGSVRAEEMMEPLELEGIVHMVSRIEGTLRFDGDASILSALFPGGSISGAPKRRAMEILSRVERSRRGPYTGSIGFVDPARRADWNIAIRTAVWQDGDVYFGCGGGIVLDSDPEREYEEAMLKARSFLESLRRLAPHRLTCVEGS